MPHIFKNGLIVYISIILPPHFIDINCHPSKKEVRMYREEEILNYIKQSIQTKLKNSGANRN